MTKYQADRLADKINNWRERTCGYIFDTDEKGRPDRPYDQAIVAETPDKGHIILLRNSWDEYVRYNPESRYVDDGGERINSNAE